MADDGEKTKRKVRQRRARGQLHLTKGSSGIYYIRGTIRGQRVRESTGTHDAVAADAIRVKRESELLAESVHGKKVITTFAECVEHYLRVRGGGSNRRHMRALLIEFGDVLARDMTTPRIHAYIEKHKSHMSGASKNSVIINPIIAVMRCAAHAGMCDLPVLQRYKEESAVITGIGDQWVSDFLSRCDRPKLVAYVALITTTGCRGIDACRLRSDQIDWDKGTATLPKTKNGDARTLQIAPLMEMLRSFRHDPDGTVFGFSRTSVANDEIAKVCRRLGMEIATGHRIGRHTFAERLLNKGYTLKDVGAMGGWRDLKTLHQRYGHLEQSRLDGALRDEAAKVLRSGLKVVNGGRDEGTTMAHAGGLQSND